MFVNRLSEKAELLDFCNTKQFGFGVVYGRRRVGKTALLLEVLKNKNFLYYLAVEKNNLDYFIAKASAQIPEVSRLKPDWEIILDFLKDKVDVIVLDEFQNLIKEDSAILSVLQRVVDSSLKHSGLKLLVSGSSVSLMTSEVLDYASPLYGRKTLAKKIIAMPVFELTHFFPKATPQEIIEIYGFADGIPYYLEKISFPFWTWLNQELAHSSFLADEMNFIMKYEFEDLGTYKTILEAIANGKATTGEIKDYAKLQRTDVSPYLAKLANTEFIERVIPVTEKTISKHGRYLIKDQFTAFWFKFVYPNSSGIQEGIYGAKNIKENYGTYLGRVFEKVCRQFLIKSIKNNHLPEYHSIGNWWHRDKEIDLIALNTKTSDVLLAECKWKNNVDATQIAKEVLEKSSYLEWRQGNRQETIMVFAKTFKKKPSELNGVAVKCIELNELFK